MHYITLYIHIITWITTCLTFKKKNCWYKTTNEIFKNKTISFIYVVFLFSAPSPKGRDCPFLGRYEISGGLNAEDVGKALAAIKPGSENNLEKPTPCNPPGKQYLTVGCNSLDTMEFQSECGTKTVAGKREIPKSTGNTVGDPVAFSLFLLLSSRFLFNRSFPRYSMTIRLLYDDKIIYSYFIRHALM